MSLFRRLRDLAAWAFSILNRLGVTRLTLVLLVLLVILASSWGFQASSRPQFCASCHEMEYYFNSWTASSHHGITCEECHLGASLGQMIGIKIGALKEIGIHNLRKPTAAEVPRTAHVSDAVCRKCHEPPTGELHYHANRMTHQAHLDRGMHCTECHANVVHGGRAGYINTPPMSGCFTCHDGEKAPNQCSLCHLKLGEIKPAVYNPAWVDAHRANLKEGGQDSCRVCHGDQFCKSCHQTVPPHPGDWLQTHEATTKEQLTNCATCHVPREGEEMARFCIDCHNARHAHGPQYLLTHPKEFQAKPDTCRLCHDEKFCDSCHQIYRPHPLDWLSKHGPISQQKQSTCATCHPKRFCEECHTHGRPASHDAKWIAEHGKAATAGTQDCKECHTQQMCNQCHSHQPPETHRDPTWKRTHGPFAVAEPKLCTTCHDQQTCNSCHGGLQMPHPSNWRTEHSHNPASRDQRHCATCHDQKFCNSCHGGSQPVSHANNWLQKHGPASEKPGANCKMCHTDTRLCSSCHALPMPHPKGWKAPSAHGAAAESKPAVCTTCHKSADCMRCHTSKPPASHSQQSFDTQHASQGADGALCSLCHGSKPCQTCHQGLPMPHDRSFTKQHGAIYQRSPKVCAACHKKTDECAACHAKITKSPHSDDFAMNHKDKASFARGASCFLCHKFDYCQQCHPDAKQK